MMNDLKKFLLKGNVIDLAVAVIIGAAFKKIIDSFVTDILMPPIGMMMGGVDFTDLKYIIQAAQGEVAAITVNYGAFIQTIVDFIIVGLSIFMAIKAYERMQKKEDAKPSGPGKEESLLIEIRDILKKK